MVSRLESIAGSSAFQWATAAVTFTVFMAGIILLCKGNLPVGAPLLCGGFLAMSFEIWIFAVVNDRKKAREQASN